MTKLRDEGLVKAIGLGVDEVQVCLDALEHAALDCFLLAGRYSLLDHDSAAPLLDACRERNASLIVGGVFNSGILATGPVPGALFDYEQAPQEILDREMALEAVCTANGVALPAAALQFPLQSDGVASVLLGVSSVRNLERSLASLKTTVPEKFWNTVLNLQA